MKAVEKVERLCPVSSSGQPLLFGKESVIRIEIDSDADGGKKKKKKKKLNFFNFLIFF